MAAVVAGVLLTGALGVWRLSQPEPLKLSFLTPYIEQALTLRDRSLNLVVDDTLITWAGWGRTVNLRVRGVHILANDGRVLAELPELSLTLSVEALLRGMIAPTVIEVLDPKIVLLREANGRFRFGRALELPENAEVPIPESPVIPAALAEFMAPPDYSKPTGYVRRISIVDADLEYVDQKTGLTWHAPSASIEFDRHRDGLVGRLRLEVSELGHAAQVEGDLVYEAASRSVSIEARFSGVDAAALGLLQPDLMILQDADFTLDGRLGTRVGIDGQLDRIDFDFAGGPGRVAFPDQYDQALPIRRLTVSGRLDAGLDRLVLDEATLALGDLPASDAASSAGAGNTGAASQTAGGGATPAATPGGPVISLAGQATGLTTAATPRSGEIRVDAQLGATGITVADLARYWPKEVGPHPRSWILSNVQTGRIDDLAASVRLHIPGGDPAALAVDKIAGTFTAKGVTIHYLKPLPPVADVSGTGSFNATSLSATFTSGHVGEISIEAGRLDLTDFEKPVQNVHVEGTARASLQAALALLDHPRLGYMTALGIDPTKVSGQAVAKLKFSFPADKDLTFEQVNLSAESSIVGASIKGVLFGKDLDDANLSLTLDRKSMLIEGTGRFAGIPSALTWRDSFVDGPYDSQITLQGTADDAQRAALGIDLSPTVTGPIPFDVTYTTYRDRSGDVAARLDLTPSDVILETVGYHKPAGAAAAADLDLSFANGRAPLVRRFSVQAPDLALDGSGSLTADLGLGKLSFDRMVLGKTSLSKVELTMAGGRPEVTVGGGQLDIEPLLAEKISLQPEPAREEPVAKETPPLRIVADHLDRVLLASDRQVENVRVVLDHGKEYWDRIEIDGTLPGGKPLSMRYVPDDAGNHQLLIASDDAGSALRVLGIFDDVHGGKLKIIGTAVDSEPRRPLKGKAEIQDFRLVNQPALARLLSVATLTGLIDALGGEGFQFNRFVADFTKTEGEVDIPLARAYGPSIGLTATGKFDHIKDTIDLKGTIVPAYGINSILGNIPVIGDLLQGGKGKGLFAATYRATGKLSQPTFTVNPLAALAPGFLRGLFDIFDSSGKPSPATALPDQFENQGQQNR